MKINNWFVCINWFYFKYSQSYSKIWDAIFTLYGTEAAQKCKKSHFWPRLKPRISARKKNPDGDFIFNETL